MATLLVVPSEPLAFYVQKGELKPRYYNPRDLFSEIHVLEPSDAKECPPSARSLFGSAEVSVHPLGPVRWTDPRNGPLSAPRRARLLGEIERLRPDVIRAYDALAAGWSARAASEFLGVPYVVSVHINLDVDVRRSLLRRKRWRGLLLHLFTRVAVERPVLRDAVVVVAAYEFAARYVHAMGRRDAEMIYNRADTVRFSPSPTRASGPGTRVLTVGSAIPERGLDLALDAIAMTACSLTVVGQGPERAALEARAAALGIADRVSFVSRVANAEMPRVYRDADIYLSTLQLGGVSIPVLEAAASGLPIIGVRPLPGEEPEIVPDVGVVCARSARAVAAELRRLATDPDLRRRLGDRARSWSTSRPDPEDQESMMYKRVIATVDDRRG